MPYCGICNLGFLSDEALEEHRIDKKHLNQSEEYQQQVLEAAHSVHVTGFSCNISHKDLTEYFANFGKVLALTHVYNTNSQCPFAFVKFENLLIASQVVRYKHHCLNGYFLRVQPKKFKYRNTPRLDASNFNSAIVNTPSRIRNEKQVGYPGKCHKKIKDVNFMAHDFNEIFSRLLKKLLKQNTLDEQIMILYEELKLADDDYVHRRNFRELLYTILEPYFPGCSVVLFGSSVNGFGAKGCDIDIFLDISHLIPSEAQPEDASNSSFKQKIEKDPMPVPMKEFFHWTPLKKIRYLLNILVRKLHTKYCNFFSVPSKRCPIVRFSHKMSGITCDFSIQNKLGLCNSYLMKFLSQYDCRLQPFVFAIRMWAKRKKLASVGGSSFSSYSLTLMILFFLQNIEPAVLPSLQKVMDACNKEEEMVCDGVYCSFPQRPAHTVLPQSKNKDLIGDLMKKFFDFFLHFDFEASVISPRAGKCLPRSEIESQRKQTSFGMSPVFVQDPYLLEHNTSANVSEKMEKKFIKELSVAKNNLCHIQADSTTSGLANLIMEESSAEEIKTSKNKSKAQNLASSLSLPINVIFLNKEMEKFGKEFHNSYILWCRILCYFLQVVLKDVLLIECCIQKGDTSLNELLKTTETKVQDGNNDCKTSSFLSSDITVINSDTTENKRPVGVINTNNANNYLFKKPGLVLKKRRSGEYIREVKHICLNDQEISDVSRTDDFNWPKYCDRVPPNFENAKIPKLSVTSCNISIPDKKNFHPNDINHRNNMIKASESNILQEKSSMDEVFQSETEKQFDDENQQQPHDPNSLLQMVCRVQHYSWRNRKKICQKLLPYWNGCAFELEKKISEHIVTTDESLNSKPSMAIFQFTAKPDINTSLSIHINPIMSTCKEVSVFYQFLSPFITRMVSSHFVKWYTNTSSQILDSSMFSPD